MTQAITTYVQYGKHELERVAGMLTPGDAPPAELLIDVDTGIQIGSSVFVDQKQFRIGGDWDDHVLILQQGDDPVYVDVESHKSPFGDLITLRGRVSEVLINGEAPTKQEPIERLPCVLTIGETELTIHAVSDQIVQSSRKSVAIAGMVLTFVLGLAILLTANSQSDRYGNVEEVVAQPSTLTPNADAIAAATAMITTAGLDQKVSLDVQDRAVTLRGQLNADDSSVWASVRRNVEGALSGTAVFDRVSTSALPDAVPGVGIAILGETPFLILKNGTTVRTGDVYVDDFVLTDVFEDGFRLSNGRDEVAITF